MDCTLMERPDLTPDIDELSDLIPLVEQPNDQDQENIAPNY